jgi:hypothetical protein
VFSKWAWASVALLLIWKWQTGELGRTIGYFTGAKEKQAAAADAAKEEVLHNVAREMLAMLHRQSVYPLWGEKEFYFFLKAVNAEFGSDHTSRDQYWEDFLNAEVAYMRRRGGDISALVSYHDDETDEQGLLKRIQGLAFMFTMDDQLKYFNSGFLLNHLPSVIKQMKVLGCWPDAKPSPSSSTAVGTGSASSHAADDRRYLEQQGGFSYIPPVGWQKEKSADRPFYRWFGVGQSEGASINLSGRQKADSARSFATLERVYFEQIRSASAMADGGGRATFLGSKEFTTLSGVRVVKIQAEWGSNFRIDGFWFLWDDKDVAMTCSCPNDEYEDLKQVFDDTARSFAVER